VLTALVGLLLIAEQATPPPFIPPDASAPPITINSCAPVVDQSSSGPTVAGIALTSSSSGIRIQFTNESPKTADLINFAVDSNGNEFVIRDVGTFSPGVSIDHKYRNGAGQAFVLPAFIAPSIKCAIASIRFTDGSIWKKGQSDGQSGAGTTRAAKLSANPARVSLERSTDSELFLVSSSEPVSAFRETDDCANVAAIYVSATGQSTATYSVRPVAAGSCTARITDEAGDVLFVPITVKA